MFSINPSVYVGLRNPKKHLKTSKCKTTLFMRAPAPGRSLPAPRRQQTVATPSPGLNCAQAQPLPAPRRSLPAACFLQPSEPSPGLTSFLQQHHFQGNIQ
ncbi:hypothetical protein P8452_53249 [Trifolium repens]|nr:hypothetical protein P8452_53249 [Trifolium repens]